MSAYKAFHNSLRPFQDFSPWSFSYSFQKVVSVIEQVPNNEMKMAMFQKVLIALLILLALVSFAVFLRQYSHILE